MLIDEAETVDDAEHDRLVAKAEADGIQPTFDRRTRGAVAVDSLGLRRGALRPAGAARGRPRGARARSTVAALPDADDIDNIVVLGMGGSGIAGDVAAGRRHRDAPGAGHGAQALPHAGVRRPAHARVRALVLGRHRGDARDGRGCARRRRAGSWPSRAAVSSPSWPRESGSLHVPLRRRDPDAARSRSARSSPRSSSSCSAWACCPRRTPALAAARSSSSRRRRDQCRPDVDAGAQPARELARQIGRTIPLVYGERRPRRGRGACGGSSR